jgi:hypothetical protein
VGPYPKTLEGKILWITRYLIALVLAVFALVLVWRGFIAGEASGVVVVWSVVKYFEG